ncbi:Fur family transcriptional regulator [Nocardioides sp. SYSU D00065]|uniref:Fur family transcriptional regulator n=1 Tax=Nocardioides sp. SYSU D00065 TaxID=2817378 RepID=UPI001B32DD8B|nr:transcriptional repressor [Nocardioides sp. SYSU D00065]
MTSTERGGPDRPTVRPTRQRRAVAAALDAFDDFRSAQEIHDLISRQGDSVGLATVYRTLSTLADAGEVDMLRTEEGEAIWRRCSGTHHHHLVCRACGATVEVEGPAVEQWADTVAAEHGFAAISHTLEVFGTCRSCSTR